MRLCLNWPSLTREDQALPPARVPRTPGTLSKNLLFKKMLLELVLKKPGGEGAGLCSNLEQAGCCPF